MKNKITPSHILYLLVAIGIFLLNLNFYLIDKKLYSNEFRVSGALGSNHTDVVEGLYYLDNFLVNKENNKNVKNFCDDDLFKQYLSDNKHKYIAKPFYEKGSAFLKFLNFKIHKLFNENCDSEVKVSFKHTSLIYNLLSISIFLATCLFYKKKIFGLVFSTLFSLNSLQVYEVNIGDNVFSFFLSNFLIFLSLCLVIINTNSKKILIVLFIIFALIIGIFFHIRSENLIYGFCILIGFITLSKHNLKFKTLICLIFIASIQLSNHGLSLYFDSKYKKTVEFAKEEKIEIASEVNFNYRYVPFYFYIPYGWGDYAKRNHYVYDDRFLYEFSKANPGDYISKFIQLNLLDLNEFVRIIYFRLKSALLMETSPLVFKNQFNTLNYFSFSGMSLLFVYLLSFVYFIKNYKQKFIWVVFFAPSSTLLPILILGNGPGVGLNYLSLYHIVILSFFISEILSVILNIIKKLK